MDVIPMPCPVCGLPHIVVAETAPEEVFCYTCFLAVRGRAAELRDEVADAS